MAKITTYDVLEIGKIITFLTADKVINSITSNSVISTINVSSTKLLNERDSLYLQNGMYVKIANINYKVSNVIKDVSFQIDATGIVVLVWALAFEYRYGTMIEVNELLELASKQPGEQMGRFPLLWFIIDNNNKNSYNFPPPTDYQSDVKLAFINLTKLDYTAEQRLNNNFIPTLQPYLDLFIATLRSVDFAKAFNFEVKEYTPYEKWYRYFYGSTDKNKMVFNACTDAIEIQIPLNFSIQYICN